MWAANKASEWVAGWLVDEDEDEERKKAPRKRSYETQWTYCAGERVRKLLHLHRHLFVYIMYCNEQ